MTDLLDDREPVAGRVRPPRPRRSPPRRPLPTRRRPPAPAPSSAPARRRASVRSSSPSRRSRSWRARRSSCRASRSGARTATTPGTPAADAELFAPFWDVYESITKSYVGDGRPREARPGRDRRDDRGARRPVLLVHEPGGAPAAPASRSAASSRASGPRSRRDRRTRPPRPAPRSGRPAGSWSSPRSTDRPRSGPACGRGTSSRRSTAAASTARPWTRRSPGSAAPREPRSC